MIARCPPPAAKEDAPTRLSLFDSWYDSYRGVVALVQCVEGAALRKVHTYRDLCCEFLK